MNTTSPETDEPQPQATTDLEPKGCGGWVPAFIAIATLVLIVAFVTCAGSTYWLFQQRGELALGTLEGALLPLLEQSKLHPDEKQATTQLLTKFIEEGRRGDYEAWQIAGVTQRLVRAPVISWGDLQAVGLMSQSTDGFTQEQSEQLQRDISRVMRGAELDKVTQFDMLDLFDPISESTTDELGYELHAELTAESLGQFSQRLRQLAARHEVPDRQYDVRLADIVRRQIEAGKESGMK